MPTATITSKGQVTIPRKVREHLRLGAGDKVDFVIEVDGSVLVRPLAGSVRELFGFLRRPGPAVSVRQMDEALVDQLSQENARIKKRRARRR